MSESWKNLVEEGYAAYERGELEEAEAKFTTALNQAEIFGENDARLPLSLNNLAAIYQEQSKYTLAEPLYKRALDLRLSLYGEKHPDIALSHHNLALLYSARHMFPLAEKHYKIALNMKEELFGRNSLELVKTLQYYAQMLKFLNRPKDQKAIAYRLKEIFVEQRNESTRQPEQGDSSIQVKN